MNNFKIRIILLLIFIISGNMLFAQSIETDYKSAISKADYYFGNHDFINAKAAYQLAIKLNPQEEYPRKQLEFTLEQLRLKIEKSGLYTQKVAKADKLFEENKYNEAIIAYREALLVLPGETYPQTQIEHCVNILEGQRILKEKFASDLEKGDMLFRQGALDEARLYYSNALSLIPEEPAATARIKSIDSLVYLNGQKQHEFNIALTNAEYYIKKNNLAEALSEYRKANSIQPGNNDIMLRISEIEEKISKEKLYETLINEADELYILKKYDLAAEKYLSASAIFPEKQYPLQMISTISSAQENMALTNQTDYDNAIEQGNYLFQQKKLKPAMDQFKVAMEIKPEEIYPGQKVLEISNLLNKYNAFIDKADQDFSESKFKDALALYSEAYEISPMDNKLAEKIKATETALEESKKAAIIDKKYEEIIAQADELLNTNNLNEALLKYQEASQLKPGSEYPANQSALIHLRQKENTELVARKFQALTTRADSVFALKMFSEALLLYQEATLIFPADTGVSGKILETRQILANIQEEERINFIFNQKMKQAEELAQQEKYEQAIVTYREAQMMKPEEKGPGIKITETEQFLLKFEAEKEASYENAIAQADTLFNNEMFEQAILKYELAARLFPDNDYPVKKIGECATKLEKIKLERKKEYLELISQADLFFTNKAYDKAINNYQAALKVKPDEPYPAQMIGKINVKMSENLLTNINTSIVSIGSGSEQRFTFTPLPIKDRQDNFILIKAFNRSKNDLKTYLNYGSGQVKNGGAVFTLPVSEEEQTVIIRIGSQYKWFSEENNWISLFSGEGDMEVSLIRIVRND